MTDTLLLATSIPTGGRSVFPKGRDTAPLIWVLLLLPVIGFGIALADPRPGFTLFMGAAGFAMLVLVLALYLRGRALRAGRIRIAANGGLHFLPPRSIRVGAVAVALAIMVPAVSTALISVLGLPMQASSSRFTTVGPYALGLLSLGLLAQVLFSFRTPAGLRVTLSGVRGVRGAKRVELAWNELLSASAPGPHGPKLALLTRSQGVILIDAHQLGSDPAIVAAVLNYYRAHPGERSGLSDGAAAVRGVEPLAR